MRSTPPSARRILIAAGTALTVALGVVSVLVGFSDVFAVRLLQALAVFGLGAAVLAAAVVLALLRLAGWREPEDEFEALVQRSERLASGEEWDDEPLGEEDDEAEEIEGEDEDRRPNDRAVAPPNDPAQFEAIVRSALDELPMEFHRALEHVAIVISDGGRRRRAYGLYQGDTIARDHFHERIVIFRDTLVRDFGHDPELLKAQVARTVRHELAHHLGWDERGVRGLGL